MCGYFFTGRAGLDFNVLGVGYAPDWLLKSLKTNPMRFLLIFVFD
jgi:hypothetical protein